MKVSRNGQVSIPAATRARWNASHVVVVDLGDRVVIGPLPDDPVAAVRGKYKERLPSTDDIRREAREGDAARERRRYG